MFFVKSKSRRRNVITALIMTLILSGGIMLDTQLSQKEPSSDCSCTELIQVQQQQEAGWFFGKHCNKKGVEKFRVFGIGFGKGKGCCPTYH